MPLFCPNCKKVMKNRNDKSFYNIHKTCFKCVIKKEDKMKRDGTFEAYRQGIKNDEIDNPITDAAFQENKLIKIHKGWGDVETWKTLQTYSGLYTYVKVRVLSRLPEKNKIMKDNF